MQYRLLGPLEVVRDERVVDLGGPKQRAVLAALLLDAGRVVPTERIVDQVWGEDAPPNVSASLQAYVSNLRRVLRDDAATAPIVRQAPGYRLDIGTGELDAARFVAAADDARNAADAGDWARVVTAAEDALAPWRGDVLADLRDEEWVRIAAVALEERWAACVEDLITGLAGVGRVTEALARARELYAAQPLREHACRLYLHALFRAGRASEALDLYREHVRQLDDELGLDPGPELRELQGAILRQDPALRVWPDRPATAAPAPELASAPPPAGTATITSTRPDTGVGRDAELAMIEETLGAAMVGSVRWIALTGPAGIGKTYLAEQALTRAARLGARVVRTGCPDDVGVPPWWPIAALVRGLGADPAQVLAQDAGAEADRARFATYERVRSLIADSAADGPLAILVDDVQWADPSSLGLLSHLAFALEGIPVVVVLTARTGAYGSDLRRLLDVMARRSGTRSVDVPPLAGADVGELVRRISGEDVSPTDSAVLWTRTGGNPFFVSEYARLPRSEREAGTVPLAVRSVLGRRLDGLDAGTLQVLRTAAVIGDTLDIALLRAATRLDPDELADLLDEAADEHIVAVAPGSRSYAFTHGLLRDEVLAGMSDARRQRLHARVAAAIGTGGSAEDLVRRAGHLVAALPLADPDETFEACSAAATDAFERWQMDAAAYWWEAALSTFDQLPAARRDPDRRDHLVRQRLSALVRAGRGQTVYEVVDTEIRIAMSDGRVSSVGRLCSLLIRSAGAWPWAAFGQSPGPLLATLEDVEPRVADDPVAHARVLAALAIGSCYAPDGRIPDRLSARALELAEGLDSTDVLADALLGRALTFSGVAERAAESVDLLDRLAAVPHEFAEVDSVLRDGLLTMACLTLGRADATAEHCRTGIEGSDRLRLPISRVQFRLAESMLALWHGDLPGAQRLFDDGVRLREQTELYFGWAPMATIVLQWTAGRVRAMTDDAAGRDETIERACIAVADGDVETADRLIGEWLATPSPVIWTSLGNWTLLAHLTADCALTRHVPRLLELLVPLRAMVAVVGQLTVVGPVSLALARLHTVRGDREAARAELATATELCERAGGLPSELACRLFAVRLDVADGIEVDTSVIDVIADRADELGLDRLADAARSLRAGAPTS